MCKMNEVPLSKVHRFSFYNHIKQQIWVFVVRWILKSNPVWGVRGCRVGSGSVVVTLTWFSLLRASLLYLFSHYFTCLFLHLWSDLFETFSRLIPCHFCWFSSEAFRYLSVFRSSTDSKPLRTDLNEVSDCSHPREDSGLDVNCKNGVHEGENRIVIRMYFIPTQNCFIVMFG